MKLIEDWIGSGTTADLLTLALFLAGALVAYFVLRLLLPIVQRAASHNSFLWDDVLLDRKLTHRISLFGPGLFVYGGVRLGLEPSSTWAEFLLRVTTAVLVVIGALTLSALLHAINTVYETKPVSRDRPIEAYLQIAQILVYLFGAILTVAVLADQSPWFFLSGLGALTAVLLLIFRDTILAFVASIQLTQNDMVDVGDWIEAPEFGADGHVTDVALHTVTVQNFDKTITRIPTYKLMNQSFRNWRGMADSGRRRIKRCLYIDLATIRFLTDEEIERFSRFEPLREYMARKLIELEEDRARNEVEAGGTADPRRLTNIGTLRAYIVAYLERLESVDTDNMTFLVRQLEPGPRGLPLQIYTFTTTTALAGYEAIQSDIFDHVLAMVPEFGMRLFQEPTGEDVRSSPPPAALHHADNSTVTAARG